MNTLEEKIKKVMYSLTVYYRGNLDFWVSKGFNRLHRRDKDSLYNYWLKKALEGDKELLQKIEELWTGHLNLKRSQNKQINPIDNFTRAKETPSLFQMAKNVTKAAANFVKGGMKIVTEEQLRMRLDICRSCDKFDAKAFNGTGRCSLCGCSTVLKLKMATEKCPIDKWLPTV